MDSCPESHLLPGYVDLGKCTRFALTNRGKDALGVPLDAYPTGGAQNHYGQTAAYDVLLVAQILVSSDKNLKGRKFRGSEQFPVAQCRPSLLIGGRNEVPCKVTPQRRGYALIEQNPHLRGE